MRNKLMMALQNFLLLVGVMCHVWCSLLDRLALLLICLEVFGVVSWSAV